MPTPALDTIWIHGRVERWQAGDLQAVDELLSAILPRLERIARKMLRGFPAVRAWAETADVLQGSLLRLSSTLRRIKPQSTRHFINLSGVQVRRELLDLARRFKENRLAQLPSLGETGTQPHGDIPEQPAAMDDLDLWCRFHEAVDQLPAEEREVMGLAFYHGWTQLQIAEFFQVNERTVRRRWQAACLELRRLMGGDLPNLDSSAS